MSTNIRILRFKTSEDKRCYRLHRVAYNDKGNIISWDPVPFSPAGNSIHSLLRCVEGLMCQILAANKSASKYNALVIDADKLPYSESTPNMLDETSLEIAALKEDFKGLEALYKDMEIQRNKLVATNRVLKTRLNEFKRTSNENGQPKNNTGTVNKPKDAHKVSRTVVKEKDNPSTIESMEDLHVVSKDVESSCAQNEQPQ